MKFEIENGQIKIHIDEIMMSISGEEKVNLIEKLSCEDEVIKHVLDQIITGYTENIYRGSEKVSRDHTEWTSPLQKAREIIAKEADKVQYAYISKLEYVNSKIFEDNKEIKKKMASLENFLCDRGIYREWQALNKKEASNDE